MADSDGSIERVLSGMAGQPGVRALLRNSRETLGRTLHSMVGSDHGLRSFRLRRAKFKPGRKLTATYDVTLANATRSTPVTVTWFAGGTPAPRHRVAAAVRPAGVVARLT